MESYDRDRIEETFGGISDENLQKLIEVLAEIAHRRGITISPGAGSANKE